MNISIVTISFNQVSYVRECLISVLTQLEAGDEYIIQDAGSTDGSIGVIENVLAEYSGAATVKFNIEQDIGPADGLNKAMRHVKNSFCYFINSDDYLCENGLNHIKSNLNRYKESDFFLFSGYVEKSEVKRKFRVVPFFSSLEDYIFGYGIFLQQGLVFRLDSFKKVGGFNPQNKSCWDRELFVKLWEISGPPKIINEDVGVFRLQKNSISQNRLLVDKYKQEVRRIALERLGVRKFFIPRKIVAFLNFSFYRVIKYKMVASYD